MKHALLIIAWRTGLIFFAGTMLQACVVVPFPVVPEEDELAPDHISWIEPGVTTRVEVVERMGEPTVVRQDGNLVIYGQARKVAGWFFGALWGSGGTMPVEKRSVLLIDYESSGVVSQVQVMRGEKSCAESGLCVEAEFELEYTGELMEHESNLVTAVVYDPRDEDRPEKQFLRSVRSCGIYLYSSGDDEFLAVENPEIGTTSVVGRGFVFWFAEPGTISVKASRRNEWSSLSFDCPAKHLRFVNLYVGGSRHRDSPRITVDGEEIGRAQVLARSLILH